MRRHSGFSLIELSIALVLLGLIVGTIAQSVSFYIKGAVVTTTQTDVEDMKSRLTAYMKIKHQLPCPAMTIEGRSSERTSDLGSSRSLCEFDRGFLPWSELGYAKMPIDGWGRPYLYLVNRNVTEPGINGGAGAYQFCRNLALNAQFIHQASKALPEYSQVLADSEYIYNHELAYSVISGGPSDIDNDGLTSIGYGAVDVFNDADSPLAFPYGKSNALVHYRINLERQSTRISSLEQASGDALSCRVDDGQQADYSSSVIEEKVLVDDIYHVESLVSVVGRLDCPALLVGVNSLENEARLASLARDVNSWQIPYYQARKDIDEPDPWEASQIAVDFTGMGLGIVASILDSASETITGTNGAAPLVMATNGSLTSAEVARRALADVFKDVFGKGDADELGDIFKTKTRSLAKFTQKSRDMNDFLGGLAKVGEFMGQAEAFQAIIELGADAAERAAQIQELNEASERAEQNLPAQLETEKGNNSKRCQATQLYVKDRQFLAGDALCSAW